LDPTDERWLCSVRRLCALTFQPSGDFSTLVRPMWLVGFQWWQAISSARSIAARVVHTVDPGRFELSAWGRAISVEGAADLLANLTLQTDAAAGFGVGANHRDPGRVDLHHQVIGHDSASRLAFAPEEGHTEVPAASAAVKARVVFGHDDQEGRIVVIGAWPAAPFVIQAKAAEKRG